MGGSTAEIRKVKLADLTTVQCSWLGCSRDAPLDEPLPPDWRQLILARDVLEVAANVPAGAVVITPDSMDIDMQYCAEHSLAIAKLLKAKAGIP